VKRSIGHERCYIIAEAGLNHNGDVELACRLIEAAADAGADAVKFQNYRTADFLQDRALAYTYVSGGREVTESQWDMFKRCELIGDRLATVANYCRKRGIDFAATPTGAEGVAECVRLGAAFLKNGSDYLGHLSLIRLMAKSGLPTILSTGMATVSEIDEAVSTYRAAGGNELVLLHCVSLYPAPLDVLNLRRIPNLAQKFECTVGFSDHSEGAVAAMVAIALGARVIERHFTLDKGLPGPDHRFSDNPAELCGLIAAIRSAEASLGEAELGVGEAELEARHLYRLSCVAARTIAAGTVLVESDITFRRPGTGLPPKAADQLIGRRLLNNVSVGHILSLDDVSTIAT